MEVLLTKTIEKLGEVGKVMEVADGYARNYLFPKGLAVPPTEHNKKRYQKKREQRITAIKEREKRAKALKEKLEGIVLEFERPAHDNKLYGSVRRRDIADKIAKEINEKVARSRINLAAPIEELGAYLVDINLYKDISAQVRVRVKEEESKEAKEAEEE